MAGILAIVTTRGGASGIHNIFTRSIAGTPIIAYTLKECEKSKLIDKTVVSTDSREVASAIGLYSAKVFIRPDEASNLLSAVKHALEQLRNSERYEPDLLVVLPGQFPLRSAGSIDASIEKLQKSGADSVAGVSPAQQSPYEMVKIDADRIMPLLDTEDTKEPAYLINNAIFALNLSLLLENDKLTGGDLRAVVMKPEESISVLDRYGFMKAEAISKSRKKDIFR